MEVIVCKTEKIRVKKAKSLILSAGNKFGSVHFRKRSDGEKRKLSFRLHAQRPTYATTPKGDSLTSRRDIDAANNMITVLDANKVVRARSGRRKGLISGRGAYRSIPLETVSRVCVNGTIYKLVDLKIKK